ncbi:MAG TPA: DUF1990 family protein [Streptosporangiaceae bacterium]
MPLTAMAAATAARLRGAELTYGEVGRTTGPLPAGYYHVRRVAVIGVGAAVFAEAADSLLGLRHAARAPGKR